MLYALFALIFSFPGCPKSYPAGVSRLAGGSDLQGFAWSAEAGRLAWVEGRFPQRTYLVAADRRGKVLARHRLKGWTLSGPVVVTRDGRRAAVVAGKLGKYDSREEPDEHGALLVDLASGAVLETLETGPTAPVALGAPAWAEGPIAVWNRSAGLAWKELGSSNAGGVAGAGAWKGVLTDAGALVAGDRAAKPRLFAADLRSGTVTHSWSAELSVAPLSARADGSVLASRWVAESGKFVLEACDPATGGRTALLETDGEIESAVETPAGVFAIAKDHSRKNDTGKPFLAPRVLLTIAPGGERSTLPWTPHKGELLGSDPVSGLLWFAVTDRDKPSVWGLATTRSALAALPSSTGN